MWPDDRELFALFGQYRGPLAQLFFGLLVMADGRLKQVERGELYTIRPTSRVGLAAHRLFRALTCGVLGKAERTIDAVDAISATSGSIVIFAERLPGPP